MRIIIIGAGEVGYRIARTLAKERQDVVIIEYNQQIAQRLRETLDAQVIDGSGSNPSVLREAGIEEADILVAVTDRDEVNMIACLIASSQAKVLTKIARVRDDAYTQVPELLSKAPLNIDLFIHPEKEAAHTALRLIEIPGAKEVVEFAQGRILLVSVPVAEDSPFVGRPLEGVQAMEAQRGNVLVVALQRGSQLIIPRGKDVIQSGDKLFVVVEREKVNPVLQSLRKASPPSRRVIIMGDSKVAVYLAHKLDGRAIATKLICSDKARCAQMAELFQRVMVLHGDGTDQDLLVEENIKDVDYFVAASQDEEANILGSLLAKQLGARRSMALVSRPAYISLISSIGVDVVLNPQLEAVNRILRYIRRGKVLSVATMEEERAEAIEVVAMETSDLVNRPLREVRFPRDAIVGALVRDGQTIVPHGDTVILPGDHVIIFAKRQAIPSVEKALMVKLEYF